MSLERMDSNFQVLMKGTLDTCFSRLKIPIENSPYYP